MSDPQTGVAEIDQALAALSLIANMTSEGRVAFDFSADRRLALAFLWVNVGSALKQFCRLLGIAQGSSPFPGPIRMRDRLCYQPPDTLSARVLWNTCAIDATPLVTLLVDLRRALTESR